MWDAHTSGCSALTKTSKVSPGATTSVSAEYGRLRAAPSWSKTVKWNPWRCMGCNIEPMFESRIRTRSPR